METEDKKPIINSQGQAMDYHPPPGPMDLSNGLLTTAFKQGGLPPYPGSTAFSMMSGGMLFNNYGNDAAFNMSHPGGQNIPPSPKSPSPPPPRVYKPCVVCNDKSSGYHYGVSSCEGCKGFFRRSVQKNIAYSCQKERNCEINKVTRNRCQHCRLKKCFDKGMSKEAVRNDRKKKPVDGDKDKTTSGIKTEKKPDKITQLTNKDSELIELILDAHRATLPGGPLLLITKASAPPSPAPSTGSSSSRTILDNESSLVTQSPATPSSSADSPARKTWENVQELSQEGIVKVVEFAKKIPSWARLTVSDQITLLKAACLEIMILRLTMRYNPSRDTLTFMSGTSVTMQEMERGGFGQLASSIFKFAASLKQLQLDDNTFAMLSCICLLSNDRSGLEDGFLVESVQEPFIDALRHYVLDKYPSKPHLFAKLLMKLTDLRSISVKGADKVLHLKQDSSNDIPPLVVEMFDRTENVHLP